MVSTSIKAARVRGQLTESKEHTATRDVNSGTYRREGEGEGEGVGV